MKKLLLIATLITLALVTVCMLSPVLVLAPEEEGGDPSPARRPGDVAYIPSCHYDILQTAQGQKAYKVYGGPAEGNLGILSGRHGIPIECMDDQ